MSGEPMIAAALLREIYAHARREFPAECCGWLTAKTVRPCKNAYDPTAHPTAADRTAETAYVIAGDDLMALNRAFRGDDPPIAIYHSHPNGRAYFSETDRTVATDPWGEGPMYPVRQLVVGLDATRVVEAALFAWDETKRAFAEVARLDGAGI